MQKRRENMCSSTAREAGLIPAFHVCSVALVGCALSGRRRHDRKDPRAQATPLAAAGVAHQQRTALPRSAQRSPVRAVAMACAMALQQGDDRQFATATALSARPGPPCRDPCWPQASFVSNRRAVPASCGHACLCVKEAAQVSKRAANSQVCSAGPNLCCAQRSVVAASACEHPHSISPRALIWSQETR